MQDFVEALTLNRLSEVKVVLASVLALLAVYQATLMAVGYGKLRLPFLGPVGASRAHKALGDTIVGVTAVVSFFCIAYFGFEAEESDAHVPVALALLGVLAFKVAVVRWIPRLGFLLPALGVTVLALFWATWLSVAAQYLT